MWVIVLLSVSMLLLFLEYWSFVQREGRMGYEAGVRFKVWFVFKFKSNECILSLHKSELLQVALSTWAYFPCCCLLWLLLFSITVVYLLSMFEAPTGCHLGTLFKCALTLFPYKTVTTTNFNPSTLTFKKIIYIGKQYTKT